MRSVRSTLAAATIALSFWLGTAEPAEAQEDGGVSAVATRAATARVRPGDRIILRFLRDRELSDSLVVNERGESSFPKIGMLRVSDMTISELQDTLYARYSEFLRLPELQIAVLRRIVVIGEVRAPNVLMVDGTFTVRDVIARAGGITDSGDRRKVWIIRNGERIAAKDWDRAASTTLDLHSGDQILVGRKNWLVMNALGVVSTGVLVASFVIGLTN